MVGDGVGPEAKIPRKDTTLSPVGFRMLPKVGQAPAERGRKALVRLDKSSCPDLTRAFQDWMETFSLGFSAACRASGTEWPGEEIMGTGSP